MRQRFAFRIAPVTMADDLASAIKLFRDYASSLEIDLSYQNFQAEMHAMPGQYAPPGLSTSAGSYVRRDAGGLCRAPAHRASRLLRDEAPLRRFRRPGLRTR